MITLTYTEAKELIENHGRDGLQDILDEMNDQPDWITCNQELDLDDVEAILQGGCASGAYMPAVTYHTAQTTMGEHGDDIVEYLENCGVEVALGVGNTWSGICSSILSAAVELWCTEVNL